MKRFGIWIGLGLVILLILAAVLEPTQVVLGRLLGDAFFESRPTRYWAWALSAGPAEQAEAQERLERGGAAAVPVLVGILQNFSSPEDAELRCAAVEILAKLGPDASAAGPALVVALQDRDPHVQAVCATALPQVGVPAEIAVPVLVEMLTSDRNIVAARALSVYRGAAAQSLPALVKLLQDTSQSTEARWNAARTIGKIGPDALSAVPVLIDMTGDPEPTIREHAAEAIGDIGPGVGPDAISALRQCMSDSYPRVRRDAVRSLGYIGPPAKDAVPEMQKLLEDPEAIVREAARNALKTVTGADPVKTSK